MPGYGASIVKRHIRHIPRPNLFQRVGLPLPRRRTSEKEPPPYPFSGPLRWPEV